MAPSSPSTANVNDGFPAVADGCFRGERAQDLQRVVTSDDGDGS